MCGIVGAVAERDVTPILLEGLKRLEYRGYDSAGVAVLDEQGHLGRTRLPGKVKVLETQLQQAPLHGHIGIAHTRWATHGVPSERNAHPHICRHRVAVVHNGIIENHQALRRTQSAAGFAFTSDTDTEVVVHQICHHLEQAAQPDLLRAVQQTTGDLEGAYALGVVAVDQPGRLVAARLGSPLVIGVGIGEYFIASDVAALLPVTQRFVFLEDGDVADLTRDSLTIYDADGQQVERPISNSELSADSASRGEYRHFMLKEIYEQPRAVSDTLEGRISNGRIPDEVFGPGAGKIFDSIQQVQILACGTSFHAGLVARYWLEALAGIPCRVDIASEFRYRQPVVLQNTLVVTISQSGETADTLAALKEAKAREFGPSLAICNVPESSLVRASNLTLMTRAGPEIGVASTKAFTTQLVALLLMTIVLGRRHRLSPEKEAGLIAELEGLPARLAMVLKLDPAIEAWSEDFADKHHTLFLGRGQQYPVALEGALKLKEISYIHAEAYPAGELKHGPLALVDDQMPVIAVAPNDELIEKLKSNLQEVRARGGKLYVFAEHEVGVDQDEDVQVIAIAPVDRTVAPIIYTVPLQLLAYHVAILKGTDVDQPRNLAKSVTTE